MFYLIKMMNEMLDNRISIVFLISFHSHTHTHTFIELTVSLFVVCDRVSQGLVRKLEVNVTLYCTELLQ
jgi:ABC-type uncharacterized transport system substrate-binding protein